MNSGVQRVFRNPHTYAVIALMLGLAAADALGALPPPLQRLAYLVPMFYAAGVLALQGGLIVSAVALAFMLPRLLAPAETAARRDAWLEALSVVALGLLVTGWLEVRRRETSRREQALLKLEAARRQLESHIAEIRRNERGIAALHAISTTINRSLVLAEVFDKAVEKIQEVLDIHSITIFLIDEKTGRLELQASRGISESFAAAINHRRIGEGFNGWVARTGEPGIVTDVTSDPRRSDDAVIREGVKSLCIVPVKSKDKLIGTMGVHSRKEKAFDAPTVELLSLIGSDLGVAAEKAFLFRELQHFTDQVSRAGEEERKRIARELHDDTIQTLVAISRRLDMFTASLSLTGDAVKPLELLQDEIDNALVRLRRVLQDLRPPTLEYLGLVPALRELVTQVQEQSGVKVALEVAGEPPEFKGEDGLLVYRVIQEALGNVWKHSGARQARVELRFDAAGTTARISDNGRGFDLEAAVGGVESGKLGLMGMKERAHLLGGTIDIQSTPTTGTTVTLTAPA